jgi:omega-6 fatty acid desaturase (delta-12 desaturase)
MRTHKELLIATRPFAKEDISRSWQLLAVALTLMLLAWAVAWLPSPLWIRVPASLLTGLLIVRVFIIYHDQQHGAIFKRSQWANAILNLFGWVVLSPSSVWAESHNTHHKTNCKDFGEHPGSFPVYTCQQYHDAGWRERLMYRVSRNPLIIAGGYISIFLINMTLIPFLLRPRQHWDAGAALLLHGLLIAAAISMGWPTLLLGLLVPLTIACGLGSYLFYAQHNFPGCKLREADNWDYVDAALQSSSFFRMSSWMHWFTGNIGYHHVHHLNSKIPFYRLPEAMGSIAELQRPLETSFSLRDVWACFQMNLWDEGEDRFVTYREGAAKIAAPGAFFTRISEGSLRGTPSAPGVVIDRSCCAVESNNSEQAVVPS